MDRFVTMLHSSICSFIHYAIFASVLWCHKKSGDMKRSKIWDIVISVLLAKVSKASSEDLNCRIFLFLFFFTIWQSFIQYWDKSRKQYLSWVAACFTSIFELLTFSSTSLFITSMLTLYRAYSWFTVDPQTFRIH